MTNGLNYGMVTLISYKLLYQSTKCILGLCYEWRAEVNFTWFTMCMHYVCSNNVTHSTRVLHGNTYTKGAYKNDNNPTLWIKGPHKPQRKIQMPKKVVQRETKSRVLKQINFNVNDETWITLECLNFRNNAVLQFQWVNSCPGMDQYGWNMYCSFI